MKLAQFCLFLIFLLLTATLNSQQQISDGQNDTYLLAVLIDTTILLQTVTVDNTLVYTTFDPTGSFPPGITLPNKENFNTVFFKIELQERTYNLSLSTCYEQDPLFDTIMYVITHNVTNDEFHLLSWNDEGAKCAGLGSSLSTVIFDGLEAYIAVGCYQGETVGSFEMELIIDYENIDYISAIRELHVDFEQTQAILFQASSVISDVKEFLEPSISLAIEDLTNLIAQNKDSLEDIVSRHSSLIEAESQSYIEKILSKNIGSESIPRIYMSPTVFGGKLEEVKNYVNSLYNTIIEENVLVENIDECEETTTTTTTGYFCKFFFTKIDPAFKKNNNNYLTHYNAKKYSLAFGDLQLMYRSLFP